MNRTEESFLDQWILPGVSGGRIQKWWFEKWRFTLTEPALGKPGITYTPDFVVILADGEVQAYEIKGHGNAKRDALNRTKLFRDEIGIRTFVCRQRLAKDGGGFDIEEY